MKKITFEKYLEEVHAEDYYGCDDDMYDNFEEWKADLSPMDLKQEFDLYINSEYVDEETEEKYFNFIINLL